MTANESQKGFFVFVVWLNMVTCLSPPLPDLFQNQRNLINQGNLVMNFRQGAAVLPSMGFEVSSSYLNQVQTKFGGNAQSLPFTVNQEAADTINNWAQDRTGDQIRELVTNLDPQTQMLLATATSYQSTQHLLRCFRIL